MKLFAQKGFASTSIHEIAKASGISKGAFYLHFKSKDALFVSILTNYIEMIQKEVLLVASLHLPPRKQFSLQLTAILGNLLQNKEFIIMQSREQVLPLNEEIQKIIYNIHIETIEFYKDNLLNIYGSKAKPYLWDLSLLLDGLLQTFIKLLLLDEQENAIEGYIDYIMKRIDDITDSIVREAALPLLDKERVSSLYKLIFFENKSVKLAEIIELMQAEVSSIDENTALQVSLDVIEVELSRQKPRIPVIHGMLSNFVAYPQFEEYINNIKKLITEVIR